LRSRLSKQRAKTILDGGPQKKLASALGRTFRGRYVWSNITFEDGVGGAIQSTEHIDRVDKQFATRNGRLVHTIAY
jgi:hypothetical protein